MSFMMCILLTMDWRNDFARTAIRAVTSICSLPTAGFVPTFERAGHHIETQGDGARASSESSADGGPRRFSRGRRLFQSVATLEAWTFQGRALSVRARMRRR
jgi:hypothetical protein